MAETTNLTTTIPSSEYAELVRFRALAENLAAQVAMDWLNDVKLGFTGPSVATKMALRALDPMLYEDTKSDCLRAEEKIAEGQKNALEAIKDQFATLNPSTDTYGECGPKN